MAMVDEVGRVADGLADEMVADGPAFQAMLGEEVMPRLAILLVGEGFGDIEVISPAGKFEAIKAESPGLGREGGKGKIGPLAGEKRDGSRSGGG